MLGIEIKIFFISGGGAFPYALGLRASMFIPLRDLLPSLKGGERKLARSEKRREKDQVCDKVEGNSSKQQNSPILGVQIISIKRLLLLMCAHSKVLRTIFFLRIPRIVQFLGAAFSAKDEDGDTVHNQPLLLSIYAQRRERERDAAVLPLRNTE